MVRVLITLTHLVYFDTLSGPVLVPTIKQANYPQNYVKVSGKFRNVSQRFHFPILKLSLATMMLILSTIPTQYILAKNP